MSQLARERETDRQTERDSPFLLTLFILLSVQASATILAILTTSSLSLAMSRAVLMNSFLEWTSPSSPLRADTRTDTRTIGTRGLPESWSQTPPDG